VAKRLAAANAQPWPTLWWALPGSCSTETIHKQHSIVGKTLFPRLGTGGFHKNKRSQSREQRNLIKMVVPDFGNN
ncbi:MAG: hypothetical protein HXO22_09475, partial [Prevotella sp.]|nr:hypothetical protein [Prevotella sp.]